MIALLLTFRTSSLVQPKSEVNAQDLAARERLGAAGESRRLHQDVHDPRVQRDAQPRPGLEVVLAAGFSVDVGRGIDLVLAADLWPALEPDGREREAEHPQGVPANAEAEDSGQVLRLSRRVARADRERAARGPLEPASPSVPVPQDLAPERAAAILAA